MEENELPRRRASPQSAATLETLRVRVLVILRAVSNSTWLLSRLSMIPTAVLCVVVLRLAKGLLRTIVLFGYSRVWVTLIWWCRLFESLVM